MSDELTRKMIDALRDMAAKVDETVEREEVDIGQSMNWPQHDHRSMRKVTDHRYERAWLSGRLLGMADTAEALLGSRAILADATPK